MTSALIAANDPVLPALDKARQALAVAYAHRDARAAKEIRDQAEAVRVYMSRRDGAGDLSVTASEIKIRAEWFLGRILEAMKEAGERAPKGKNKAHVGPNDMMPTTLDDLGISRDLASQAQKIASLDEKRVDEIVSEARAAKSALTTVALLRAASGKIDTAHVSHNSGEMEWYTPPEYIEAARRVMGGIDLDPASCAKANKIVGAKKFFSQSDDGLTKEWRGRVWMNPPYAKGIVDAFTAKLATEVRAKRVATACILVNNATDTGWFKSLADVAAAVCFPEGRVKFIDQNGKPSGAPLQGQAIIYVGDDVERFVSEMSRFGLCWLRAGVVGIK